MADKMHRKKRNAREMIQYFFLINICQTIYPIVASLESQGQAFIQTDNELRYTGMGSGVLQVLSVESDFSSQDGVYSSSSITFDPAFLDFEEQSVGMPHMQQVTVQNLDPDKSLHLLSISGSTQHFHCSFFQDKKVPPAGNTTFEVVFLARQVGNVENTLFIHTSQGSYRYQVFGIGVPNPYRVRPILGAKVPMNSSFTPLINMHNPHSETLQVHEIFTTGGDLHLELPTGEKEAPRDLWEIPPYETKPIMKANFLGRTENNHTAYIRIKTNKENEESILILPVEVEVSSVPGIYSPLDMLDFEILRTQDEPKTLRISLLNSGEKAAYITNVTVHPPNAAISIDFRQTQIKPDILNPAPVAVIGFNASRAKSSRHWSGYIRIHTKQKGIELSIPYQANIYTGLLGYNINNTLFYTGDSPVNITRDLTITNTFNFTLVIYNISLGVQMLEYFSFENFEAPLYLSPQQSVHIVTLKFHPKVSMLHFNSEILLHTNASRFSIPISVYDGMLRVIPHRPETSKGHLDFGTLGVGERRSMKFTLRNDNPIDMTVTKYYNNMEKASVELVGVEKGNGTFLQSENSHIPSSGNNDPFVLPPYHFAVFTVNLIAPNMEGSFSGSAKVIITWEFDILPQKQKKELLKNIPIKLTTAEGSLKLIPSKLLMERCFPGKFCHQDLVIHSSFRVKMSLWEVTFSPSDDRFYYTHSDDPYSVTLAPYKDTDIGRLYFDLKRECQDECYVGMPTHSTAGHHWLLGCALDKDVADTDQYLYTKFQQRWQALINSQSSMINITMNIDTDKAHGFLFQVQAHLHWPSIARKKLIQFPLTQIGNISISEFLVENPGDVPIVIQVLPLSHYPNPHTILELMADSFSSDLSDFIDTEDTSIFTLPTVQYLNNSLSDLETILGAKPHKDSVAIVLPGGKTKKIAVGFQPKDDHPKTSLLVIRNNLTIIDTVVVRGQGGRGEIRFSNRKPGSNNPLLFEMTEKHLKSCDKKRQSKSVSPNFSVKRTFTARNIGELPFYVHDFSISRSHCEGYGFKVLDCQGFELAPNGSKRIDIVFTPDFTMSRIRRILTLHTSLGPAMNYTLQATVPSHMLSKCAAALPRPNWEPIIYYSTICIMGFLLFCIFVAAYFEADRIFHSDMFQRRPKVSSSTQTFDKGKVFDLKTVAGVRGHDGQVSPTSIYPNNRLVQQMNNNLKGYSMIANGHAETVAPHLIRRSRKETTSRSSRLLTSARGLWSTLWGWLWSDTATTTTGGSTSQRPSSAGTNCKSQKNYNNHSVANSKAESQKARLATKDSTSWLHRISKFLSSYVSDSSVMKRQHCQKAKAVENDVQHVYNDTDLPTVHSNNRKSMNDGESLSDRLSLSHDNAIQHINDEDADDEEIIRKEGSVRKLKQKKYRAELKRPKERFSDLDRDDTSSTTTESSSCLETDDKAFSTRDTTPDPLPPKNKKAKPKSRREKTKPTEKDEDDNEEEFIITSKSKAHRGIKGEATHSYGGNIFRPNTLELPYTTKLEARKSAKNCADQLDMITTMAGPPSTSRTTKGPRSKTRTDDVSVDSQLSSSMLDFADQCDPDWDMPCTRAAGDLSQLSIQTEQFVKSHQTRPSEDLLTPGGRNPTFSSVVSSELNDVPNQKINIGKYPPTPGGMDHNSPVDTAKHPGTIGSKPTSRPGSSSGSAVRNSSWSWISGSGSNPSTPDGSSTGNSFGLRHVPEDFAPGSSMSVPGVEPLTSSYQNNIFPGLQDGLGPLSVGTYGQQNPPALPPQPPAPQLSPSMLMQLQAERRQRRLEYQQNIHSREDWPGFDLTSPLGGASGQQDSLLWDQSSAPVNTETWSTLTDSPQRRVMNDNMWNGDPSVPAASTAAGWTTGTMWGATGADLTSDGRSSMMNLTPPPLEAAATASTDNGASFMRRFDPFSTLASIWNPPTSTAYSGSNWTMGGNNHNN